MEQPFVIETKKKPKDAAQPEKALTPKVAGEVRHAESVALFEKHRDFFEHYAQGRVRVEPAPADLEVDTFAINLETGTLYMNDIFYQGQGFSEQRSVFATCHEIEHLKEILAMLREEGGTKRYTQYLKRVKESRAFSATDNCVADIHENRAVVMGRPGMTELEQKIYKEDLFPNQDLTGQLKHLQLGEALLRESRVPDEKCIVAPEVRSALDEIAKVPRLIEIMTDPDTPMSLRLRLQDTYIMPKVEALRDKDVEDRKEQKKKGEAKKKKDAEKDEKEKARKGEPNPEPSPEMGEDEESDETDPNKIFAKEYDEHAKKFGGAVPLKKIEKALKAWKEAENTKDTPDKADGEYAAKLGVEKEYLQKYRKEVEALAKVVNPETGESILEELKNLFSRIISKRIKPQFAPRYPVTEGDELVDPAQLVADVMAGNLEPHVWEDTEIREKKGDRFGEVEITLVCDRSSSMTEGDGQKAVEQRKSAVLMMEALREFAEMCEEERMNIDHPLEVKSEIYTFSGSAEDRKPLKAMSSELGEAERINVLKKLYDLPGSTTDYVCLDAIVTILDDQTKQKIQEGVLKKIVIIFTDGESGDATLVQRILNGGDEEVKENGIKKKIHREGLREKGVVVVGVGVTQSGAPTLTTYAPNALVVEDVAKLPVVLGELLKEHLKDL